MPFDIIIPIGLTVTDVIELAPSTPPPRQKPRRTKADPVKGWKEIRDFSLMSKAGDVVARPGCHPASIFNTSAYYFLKGQGGYMVKESSTPRPIYQMLLASADRAKGVVWRKAPAMNPIFSRPLPLP